MNAGAGRGSEERDGVLLLHGLGRTARAMVPMERALRASGYRTLNLDYPSRSQDLAALAAGVWTASQAWMAGIDGQVHLVTHSMGGLVARALITTRRPPNLGRVVMLAPPNGGSEIVDRLGATRTFGRVFGPAGRQFGTRPPAQVTALLGPVDFPLGVIAADRTVDPLGWALLPKPNDGKVAVARTRVVGMADHIVLPATHTFLMRNPAVIAAALDFLRDGRFGRPADARHRA